MLQVTPQVAAAIAGEHDYCHLIRLELANNVTLRMTDCGYTVNWQGEIFESNGLLLGMDAPTFNAELRIGEIGLAFTAADQSIVALMTGVNQINRYAYIFRAFLTDGGEVIPDPILLHTWLLNAPDVSDSKGESQITTPLTSEWADFEAPRGRRSTDASQRRFFQTDKGLEFAAQVKKDLKWGGE